MVATAHQPTPRTAAARVTLLQSVLDAAPANVVVLDREGGVVLVNQRWRRFALGNGAPAAVRRGVGLNYLAVCRQAAAAGDALAQAAVTGITQVMRGRHPHFDLEYPCHSPRQQRWFRMRVMRRGGRRAGVVILHFDVTTYKQAAAELEKRRARLEQLVEERTRDLLQKEARCRQFLEMTLDGVVRYELPKPLPTRLPERLQVWRILRYTRLAECNRAFARQYGYRSPQTIQGRRLKELMAGTAAERRALVQRFIRAGYRISGLEAQDRDARGRVFWTNNNLVGVVEEGCLRSAWAIQQDITRRKQDEAAIQDLSGQLLRVQDAERRRLAHELHDTTAQSLAALAMLLTTVQDGARGLSPTAQRALARARSLADRSSQELRTLSFLLPPTLLDELGLSAALHWYIAGFQERSGVRVALVVPRHLPRWPQDVETAVFRIVQESLSNVQRHSGSRRARVRLRSQGRLLMAEVTDWGRGFDPAKQQSGRVSLGVGLRGMRERVRQLGGELAITSGAGGTTIRVRIPRPAPHLLRLPA